MDDDTNVVRGRFGEGSPRPHTVVSDAEPSPEPVREMPGAMTHIDRAVNRVRKIFAGKNLHITVHYQDGSYEHVPLELGDVDRLVKDHPLLNAEGKKPSAIYLSEYSATGASSKARLVNPAQMEFSLGRVVAEHKGYLPETMEKFNLLESLERSSTGGKVAFGLSAAFSLLSFANAYQQFSHASYKDTEGERHYIPSQLMWGALSTVFGAALAAAALVPHIPSLRGR